jgi:excisionase family DNA binding protein
MESTEPKPAFQTIKFPERINLRDSELPGSGSQGLALGVRLLTPQEVASRLGVSERWVRDHATRRFPRIPAVKLGPLLRFRLSDIEDFLNENSVPGSSKKRAAGV